MAPTVSLARSPLAQTARRSFHGLLLASAILMLAALFPPLAASSADRLGTTDAAGNATPPKPPTAWQLAGLKAAFADPSPGTREAALIVCADMGWGALLEPAQIAPYLEHLPRPDEDANAAQIRTAAARAAGQMGERGAVFAGQLAELTKSESSSASARRRRSARSVPAARNTRRRSFHCSNREIRTRPRPSPPSMRWRA